MEYTAAADCPTRRAFEAELAEHLGTATFARFGELARTLSVVIEPEPSGFRARVELIDRQGQSTERGVSAPTCDQAMRAIALVAALAARSQVEQADREHEASAAPNATSADSSDAPPPLPPAAATEPPPSASMSPERSGSADLLEEKSLSFGLSAGAAAATGVGPSVAPGLLVGLRVALTGVTERSVVLSLLGYDTFQRSLDVADARFSVLKGRLELCPVEPRLSDGVLLSPCAGFELGSQTGRTYADGDRVETPGDASELWLALSVAARLGLRFGALELAFGLELGVPLRRNRYALSRPDRLVYQVPRVTGGVSVTIGFVW